MGDAGSGIDRHRACMQAVVTKDDVVRGKPAPDVYLEAVRRLGATPSRSFAVEDSAPGLASARAAGLRTIAVPHWLTLEHDLSAADVRVADARDITLGLLQNLLGKAYERESWLWCAVTAAIAVTAGVAMVAQGRGHRRRRHSRALRTARQAARRCG